MHWWIIQPLVELPRTDHLETHEWKLSRSGHFSSTTEFVHPLLSGLVSGLWSLSSGCQVACDYFQRLFSHGFGPPHVVLRMWAETPTNGTFHRRRRPCKIFSFREGVTGLVTSGKSGGHLGVILSLKQKYVLTPHAFFGVAIGNPHLDIPRLREKKTLKN